LENTHDFAGLVTATANTQKYSTKGNIMFCRNCAKEVSDKAIACPGCGVPPRIENKFCPHCGKPTTTAQIICTACGVGLTAPKQKSKVTAGILGLLLGVFGVHKFYLGYTGTAVLMLCLSLIGGLLTFGIAAGVLGTIGFIEGIIYLTKSDEQFSATYLHGRRTWF
jgi:TM2 domain-containing membrane protein YozV